MTDSQQPAASSDEPDWLKGFEGETELTTSKPSTGELSWLDQLGEESKSTEPASNELDFLNQLSKEPEPAASSSTDFDFLKDLGNQPETTPAASSTDDFDFLNELSQETEQLAPASASEPPMKDNLGMSENERDDSFAWLESLAAKQGATEGLLTQPEDRLEEEPEWVKQAKSMETPASQPPAEKPTAEQPPVAQPTGSLEELGKTEQEQDDSFAWLESLAAKQGATEGLLTQPEERLEEEPEWVRQAKSLKDQPQEMPSAVQPTQETPEETQIPEPTASLEELGKTEQEQDDSFAWLESLAAKQGATEGLLTQPEERLEEEPEWVKQAKDLSAEQLFTPEQTTPSMDDTAMWLRSLDEESASEPEPASSHDDTAIWFKKLESSDETPSQPAESAPGEDLPAWMQNLEEEKMSETQFNIPIDEIESSTAAKEASATL